MITAKPKTEPPAVITETPPHGITHQSGITPTPAPPTNTPRKLTQTGLMRWPMLAMGLGSLLLFAIGWAMAFYRRKNNG